MNDLFSSATNVRDIVTRFPKSGALFHEYQIDYCFQENRSLQDAILEHNLDASEVIDQLKQLYAENKEAIVDWENCSFTELVDYIVNTHHAYLNKVLPALSGLLTTILRVHGSIHSELYQVHSLFHELKMELEQHLIKEEERGFPLIRAYDSAPGNQLELIAKTIEAHNGEHAGVGNILRQMRDITQNYAIPDDVCESYQYTYKKLKELEADLFQHIHLENNVLFPKIQNTINAKQTA